MPRVYKIFTDGRKNLMTVPAWTDFKKGDGVLITQHGEFLLVMRAKSKETSWAKKGEALRGVIDDVLTFYGLGKHGPQLLSRVVESFKILQGEIKNG